MEKKDNKAPLPGSLSQRSWFLLLTLLALAFPNLLQAHGMVYEVETRQTVAVSAAYDDGDPMSYAAVKIFAPGDVRIEYQNGRTDKNGCFAFMPDASGQWRIIVDGGMGHVINTTFEVNEALVVPHDAAVSRSEARTQGLLAGLGFIFGMTGIGFYLSVRRSRSRSA